MFAFTVCSLIILLIGWLLTVGPHRKEITVNMLSLENGRRLRNNVGVVGRNVVCLRLVRCKIVQLVRLIVLERNSLPVTDAHSMAPLHTRMLVNPHHTHKTCFRTPL